MAVVDRRFVCSQVRSRYSPYSVGSCMDGRMHRVVGGLEVRGGYGEESGLVAHCTVVGWNW